VFGRRALPGTRWGNISAPLDPLAAIGGGVLLLKGIEGRGRKGKERERGRKGRGTKWRDTSFLFNFWLQAWTYSQTPHYSLMPFNAYMHHMAFLNKIF